MSMGKEQTSSHGWTRETTPYLVGLLVAAHVIALVYWMFRLAADKQIPRRRKTH